MSARADGSWVMSGPGGALLEAKDGGWCYLYLGGGVAARWHGNDSRELCGWVFPGV